MSRTTTLAFALAAAVALGCGDQFVPTVSVPDHAVDARGGNDYGPLVLAALAQVRQLTATYHDLDAAMADGYTVWSPSPFVANATCPSSAEGNMGYHLLKPSLRGSAANPAAGDAVIDPTKPEMLLYEKRADGQMHLVGVEYLVFKAAWEREHGTDAAPPTVFGQPLLASAHTFPGTADPSELVPHYELHVWIWASNPLGMFYPWNPTVSC
jgi:hypothetical protein